MEHPLANVITEHLTRMEDEDFINIEGDCFSYDITYEFKDDEAGWVPATFTNIDKNAVMNLMQAEFMHF